MLLLPDWDITGPIYLMIGLIVAFVIVATIAVIRSQRRKPVAGGEDIIGLTGTVRTRLTPEGSVQVRGEIWQAVSDGTSIEPGTKIVVTAMEGLTLRVKTKGEKDA
ncbi:MAG: hypothetical protein JW846_08805 [Dehalococcoidia bacterium]|nr:hypothetical protein [Dehalococcoidia bacterium]